MAQRDPATTRVDRRRVADSNEDRQGDRKVRGTTLVVRTNEPKMTLLQLRALKAGVRAVDLPPGTYRVRVSTGPTEVAAWNRAWTGSRVSAAVRVE